MIDNSVSAVRVLAPEQTRPDQRQRSSRARFLHEPALVQVQHVARVIGRFRIVRHHDDGLAVFAIQQRKQVEDLVGGVAVEVAGRFVADQQRRIGDERARDRDALLLAAGQFARLVARAVREPDDLQRRRGILLSLRAFSDVSSSGSSTLRCAVSTGSRL